MCYSECYMGCDVTRPVCVCYSECYMGCDVMRPVHVTVSVTWDVM